MGDPGIVVPLAGMILALAIVGIVHTGKTIRYYLDWRMRMVDRQASRADGSVASALQDLRTEIAALRKHEGEAILSFDSTLQTLNARLKHVERQALGQGAAERTPLAVTAPPAVHEAAPVVVSGATGGTVQNP